MKFLSYKLLNGKPSWGVLAANGKILDLSGLAPSLLDFLRSDWEARLPEVRKGLSQGNLPLESVKLDACIPNPPSMRDGYAFRQHVEAARRNRGVPMIEEFDLFPIFYFMNHYAVTGPGPLPVQRVQLDQLDFELEAAVVVGKSGRNIPAKDADKYIFGYTIMNDWSARRAQMDEMKLSLGPAKGKDFATSLGPWLVTPDELAPHRKPSDTGDRYDLAMTAEVNGKEVSRGSMASMTWSFAQILERVSYGANIYPGDVIGSGTVGTGCFLELNGSGITNQWLKPGDRVVLKIAGLGELENTIETADETPNYPFRS